MMSEAALASTHSTDAALQRIPFGAPAEQVAAAIASDGAVILTGVLTREQVAEVNKDLDPHFDAIGQGNFGQGEENFLADFMGHRTKRVVHCVRYSKTLRDVMLASPVLAEYVSALVPGAPGNHSLGSSQAIEIHPGEKAQTLHRDANTMLELLQRFERGGPEMLINSLLGLTDVTEEMGATRVIPGSHLWDDYRREATQAETIPALLNAGDLLLFSGRVLHGGGANVTKDRPRRVLSTAFAISFFMGEEAWPFVIPVEEVRTYPKQVQGYLGFRSVSFAGEEPGFLWRVEAQPLEEHLAL